MKLEDLKTELYRLLYNEGHCETNVQSVSNIGTKIVFEIEEPEIIADLKLEVENLEDENWRLESKNDQLGWDNEELRSDLKKEHEKHEQTLKALNSIKARCEKAERICKLYA